MITKTQWDKSQFSSGFFREICLNNEKTQQGILFFFKEEVKKWWLKDEKKNKKKQKTKNRTVRNAEGAVSCLTGPSEIQKVQSAVWLYLGDFR
jgi:hypothetical protein